MVSARSPIDLMRNALPVSPASSLDPYFEASNEKLGNYNLKSSSLTEGRSGFYLKIKLDM